LVYINPKRIDASGRYIFCTYMLTSYNIHPPHTLSTLS